MTTYPRPDFQRTSLNWTSLDGPWSFTFDDTDTGRTEKWQKTSLSNSNSKREIQVPYAFQTPASGINLLEAHEVMWYERSITDIRSADERTKGNRLLVRFGAVDYECEAWVDGSFVGGHRGGHVPFDVDVTDVFDDGAEEARLTLRVRDSPYDLTQPRGKQFWKPVPESIFYTPSSGIWLSVWLESVPSMRIACGSGGTVLRSDDVDGGILHAQVSVLGRRVGSESAAKVEIEASLGGVFVGRNESELPRDRNIATLDLGMTVSNLAELQKQEPFTADGVWHDGVALWAPEHPILYDITLRLYNNTGNLIDEVQTTTGMRSLSWQTGDGTFRLNGKPYFQMLFLDQGYWPESGMTPPSSEALKTDIELAKKIGFNGCRKHQKVEDPRFYYWADRLGFVVWGEMANAYEFGGEYVERFTGEWTEAVKRDINHPSIVTWTPVNESWAVPALKDNIEQRNHVRALYYLTKYDQSHPEIYISTEKQTNKQIETSTQADPLTTTAAGNM
jgi:beta-galactosidase/beta-glucuronidase